MDKDDPAQEWTRKTKLKCGQEKPRSSADKEVTAQVWTRKTQVGC